MVRAIGSHVNIMRHEVFEKAIPEDALRKSVSAAYFSGGLREFDVLITTTGNLMLSGLFTASAIVQLTNQDWVKMLTERSVARKLISK